MSLFPASNFLVANHNINKRDCRFYNSFLNRFDFLAVGSSVLPKSYKTVIPSIQTSPCTSPDKSPPVKVTMIPIKWVSSMSEVKQLAVKLDDLRTQSGSEDQKHVYLAGLGNPILNRHGKLQSLGVMISGSCLYIITTCHLSPLTTFLKSNFTKVLFDCRDLVDCMLRSHSLSLSTILDFQITELVVRGEVPTKNPLPVEARQRDGKITTVVLRDKLLTAQQCGIHYLDRANYPTTDTTNMVEYYRSHFSFLEEIHQGLLQGSGRDARPKSSTCLQSILNDSLGLRSRDPNTTRSRDPNTTRRTTDTQYLMIVSHRFSKLNSGKTFRDGGVFDTHCLVYQHVLEPCQVLCLVECALCHVILPVDSFDTRDLYATDQVCSVCRALKEQQDKLCGYEKKPRWVCFGR